MLREPAGEMDLENGFTGGPKKANYTLYCAVSGVTNPARRFTAYTFHAIAHPKMQTKTQRGAGRQKSAEDKNSKISDRQLDPLRAQNRRPHIGLLHFLENAQDEEHHLAATPHLRRSTEMPFWAQCCVDPLNIGVCGDLGLSGPPPTPHLETAQKGRFWGHFRASAPLFFPLLAAFWPKNGSIWAHFWKRRPREPWFCGPNAPHFGLSIVDPGNLPLRGWGVDNFCILGPDRGGFWTQFADLDRDPPPSSGSSHFGPVASSDLPFWQRPAHFRHDRHEFAGSAHPISAGQLRTPGNIRASGLGVDNFGDLSRPRSHFWGQSSHLELTTASQKLQK